KKTCALGSYSRRQTRSPRIARHTQWQDHSCKAASRLHRRRHWLWRRLQRRLFTWLSFWLAFGRLPSRWKRLWSSGGKRRWRLFFHSNAETIERVDEQDLLTRRASGRRFHHEDRSDWSRWGSHSPPDSRFGGRGGQTQRQRAHLLGHGRGSYRHHG